MTPDATLLRLLEIDPGQRLVEGEVEPVERNSPTSILRPLSNFTHSDVQSNQAERGDSTECG
jgi:hypothetical protein